MFGHQLLQRLANFLYTCLRIYRLLDARTPYPHDDPAGHDLQNILRQSYDRITIMVKLRSTYDGHLIYKTSYEVRKAFLE